MRYAVAAGGKSCGGSLLSFSLLGIVDYVCDKMVRLARTPVAQPTNQQLPVSDTHDLFVPEYPGSRIMHFRPPSSQTSPTERTTTTTENLPVPRPTGSRQVALTVNNVVGVTAIAGSVLSGAAQIYFGARTARFQSDILRSQEEVAEMELDRAREQHNASLESLNRTGDWYDGLMDMYDCYEDRRNAVNEAARQLFVGDGHQRSVASEAQRSTEDVVSGATDILGESAALLSAYCRRQKEASSQMNAALNDDQPNAQSARIHMPGITFSTRQIVGMFVVLLVSCSLLRPQRQSPVNPSLSRNPEVGFHDEYVDDTYYEDSGYYSGGRSNGQSRGRSGGGGSGHSFRGWRNSPSSGSNKQQGNSGGTGGAGQDPPRHPNQQSQHATTTVLDPFEEFQSLLGPNAATIPWPVGVRTFQGIQRMQQVVSTARNHINTRMNGPWASSQVRDAAEWAISQTNVNLKPPTRVVSAFATYFEAYIAIAGLRNGALEAEIARQSSGRTVTSREQDDVRARLLPDFVTTPSLVESLLSRLERRIIEDGLAPFTRPMPISTSAATLIDDLRSSGFGFSSPINLMYHFLKHGFDGYRGVPSLPWEQFLRYLNNQSSSDEATPGRYLSDTLEFIRSFPPGEWKISGDEDSTTVTLRARNGTAIFVVKGMKSVWFLTYFRR